MENGLYSSLNTYTHINSGTNATLNPNVPTNSNNHVHVKSSTNIIVSINSATDSDHSNTNGRTDYIVILIRILTLILY